MVFCASCPDSRYSCVFSRNGWRKAGISRGFSKLCSHYKDAVLRDAGGHRRCPLYLSTAYCSSRHSILQWATKWAGIHFSQWVGGCEKCVMLSSIHIRRSLPVLSQPAGECPQEHHREKKGNAVRNSGQWLEGTEEAGAEYHHENIVDKCHTDDNREAVGRASPE